MLKKEHLLSLCISLATTTPITELHYLKTTDCQHLVSSFIILKQPIQTTAHTHGAVVMERDKQQLSDKIRNLYRDCGYVVAQLVEALHYKPESCRFNSRWCHWNFSLTQSFQQHYGPGVDSASNRNEHQEYFLEGKGGRCVGLTTLPPSCANCLETWEPQPPGTLRACTGIAFAFLCTLKWLYNICNILQGNANLTHHKPITTTDKMGNMINLSPHFLYPSNYNDQHTNAQVTLQSGHNRKCTYMCNTCSTSLVIFYNINKSSCPV